LNLQTIAKFYESLDFDQLLPPDDRNFECATDIWKKLKVYCEHQKHRSMEYEHEKVRFFLNRYLPDLTFCCYNRYLWKACAKRAWLIEGKNGIHCCAFHIPDCFLVERAWMLIIHPL